MYMVMKGYQGNGILATRSASYQQLITVLWSRSFSLAWTNKEVQNATLLCNEDHISFHACMGGAWKIVWGLGVIGRAQTSN